MARTVSKLTPEQVGALVRKWLAEAAAPLFDPKTTNLDMLQRNGLRSLYYRAGGRRDLGDFGQDVDAICVWSDEQRHPLAPLVAASMVMDAYVMVTDLGLGSSSEGPTTIAVTLADRLDFTSGLNEAPG